MTCTYLGNRKFQITTTEFDVIVVISCEVEEQLKGDDIKVYPRDRGDLTYEDVNETAMQAIEAHLKAAGLVPAKRRKARG